MKFATPLGGGLPTPRTSAGLVGPGQGKSARAQWRAAALPRAAMGAGGPRVPAGTPRNCPWMERSSFRTTQTIHSCGVKGLTKSTESYDH
jgi:hypothetical protein